ncbi:hypothetical protein TRIATDRAFT_302804 [Trichoderma atroviride IMI 206040]|uniref:Uncharacterized protein n=1 Tax=Hypocrea atroviridis (strain ATCC 20476 / IMI 206040) TaxID=452589 RepID=G9PA12_HYPAI|nr:uncharacterized protein TRIATDRAFT_302804 [Trichoderma atroviride IMI 206040]EHK40483.1 hypothetical protein TRIATDRAFT_302804 [Trichoderma atroviride IMI 206040]
MPAIPPASSPPKFKYGERVQFENQEYTIASFDPAADEYAIFLVKKVKKKDLERPPLEDQKKEGQRTQSNNASSSGSQSGQKTT